MRVMAHRAELQMEGPLFREKEIFFQLCIFVLPLQTRRLSVKGGWRGASGAIVVFVLPTLHFITLCFCFLSSSKHVAVSFGSLT